MVFNFAFEANNGIVTDFDYFHCLVRITDFSKQSMISY